MAYRRRSTIQTACALSCLNLQDESCAPFLAVNLQNKRGTLNGMISVKYVSVSQPFNLVLRSIKVICLFFTQML